MSAPRSLIRGPLLLVALLAAAPAVAGGLAAAACLEEVAIPLRLLPPGGEFATVTGGFDPQTPAVQSAIPTALGAETDGLVAGSLGFSLLARGWPGGTSLGESSLSIRPLVFAAGPFSTPFDQRFAGYPFDAFGSRLCGPAAPAPRQVTRPAPGIDVRGQGRPELRLDATARRDPPVEKGEAVARPVRRQR